MLNKLIKMAIYKIIEEFVNSINDWKITCEKNGVLVVCYVFPLKDS